jgi:hypothetical protein
MKLHGEYIREGTGMRSEGPNRKRLCQSDEFCCCSVLTNNGLWDSARFHFQANVVKVSGKTESVCSVCSQILSPLSLF